MLESEIRKIIIARLASSSDGKEAAFIAEMFIDGFTRRADLVVANGKLAVFEIKSAHDSLDRLAGQIDSYVRFFEQVTVVCAEKHLSSVKDQLPKAVGLWLVSADGHISIIRKARTEKRLTKWSWLSFLPVDELRTLLRHYGEKSVGTRDLLINRAEQLPEQVIRNYTLAFLKRRELRIDALRKRRTTQRALAQAMDLNINRTESLAFQPTYTPAIPRQRSH